MINVFLKLLTLDLTIFLRTIKDKLLNSIIWVVCQMVISGYMLPSLGLSSDFGVFQAASAVTSVVGFEIYAAVFNFFSDLEGGRYIFYELSLPIRPAYLLLQKMITYTINGVVMMIVAIFASKAVLLGQLSLLSVSWGKLLLSCLVVSWFFAAFTLFLISLIRNAGSIENVMMRILFPLWFMGGFQYSVKGAFSVSPLIGGMSLISPHTYANEALRVCLMGQSGYLPFWLSISTLLIASVICFYVSFQRLRLKLNFVE